jgi:hypothetical protein
LGFLAALVILQLRGKVHEALGMLTSLREREIPCKEDFDELMKNQVTHNCTVEAQVMLALFLLLHHVTHHAFFEDYYAKNFAPRCHQPLASTFSYG